MQIPEAYWASPVCLRIHSSFRTGTMSSMSSYLAPPVSVVIPVRNEERYLEESVAGVLNQGYPGQMEVILAIAPSTDRTAEIAQELAARDDRIRVIDNPGGTTPKALNLGVAASQYEIIVRVDAHGELGPEYIATAVELLERTGAANVGGVMDAKGRTPFEQAVAVAYTSKLGLGSSAFHQGNAPEGPAETVFLGVFRKADLEPSAASAPNSIGLRTGSSTIVCGSPDEKCGSAPIFG